MTVKWMSIPLFNALMNAGVDEELARAAASAATTPDHLESRIEALNTKINTLMWILGIGFAVLFTIGLTNMRWLLSIAIQLPPPL